MIQLPGSKKVKARNSRDANAPGIPYVVVAGAPRHYIPGFGVVGPGAVITLPEGVDPGDYLAAVNPSDAVKAASDEDKANALAEAAAERAKAEKEAALAEAAAEPPKKDEKK